MTAIEQLNAYLRKLEQRIRVLSATRGIALVAGIAVASTVLLSWLLNQFAFMSQLVLPARVALYAGVFAAIALALVVPLRRLNRKWVAHYAEERLGGFDQRLLTLAEKRSEQNPFAELVAEEALTVARQHQPEHVISAGAIAAFAAGAVLATGLLFWMIKAAPGYWGYGASLLWSGKGRSEGPLYDIAVQPGNKTVRRKMPVRITAQTLGFSDSQVTLWTKDPASKRFEAARMQPNAAGPGFEFAVASLGQPIDYYVSAGKVHSKTFHMQVKDMPNVQKLETTIHYPKYLGLKDEKNATSGDVRAVEGSQAEIRVLPDKPLKSSGVLLMEGGERLALKPAENGWYTAQFDVTKNSSYHVAALDEGDAVRLSEDYFVEAKKDEAPSVKIVNPARDPHVTPIEELQVSVESNDDFGVKKLQLHYSLNGGEEKVIALPRSNRNSNTVGKALLSFEDLKAVPGDLVSYYATASDAQHTARTDIAFAQAEPFDLRFKQSQAAGGGGGGGAGNGSEDISERQKQIIAATWNQIKNGSSEKDAMADEARFLSEVEAKLSEQAKTLAARMRAREMGETSELSEFSKQMDLASGQMAAAVGELKKSGWKTAISPEQQALRSLMRAESLFKDIQVAYNRSNGGGGSGSQNAGRDLERMFDLELDTEKNQYETGETASAANAEQKQMDEALERLKALARRQQELARQRPQEQLAQQRWEQEMLRREAEQLQRDLQQMAQNSQRSQQASSQSSQQGSPQNGGQQSSGQSGQSSTAQSQGSQSQGSQSQPQGSQGRSNSASASAARAQMQEMLRSLQRAQEEMRNAASKGDSTARNRAANELTSAQQALQGARQQQEGNSLADLSRRAQQMSEAQKDFSNRLRSAASRAKPDLSANSLARQRANLFANRWNRDPYDPTRRSLPSARTKETEELANEKDRMADELSNLQREIERQSRGLRGTDPDTARKLGEALNEIGQADLAAHMKQDAEWIRNGYGRAAWVNEQGATMGLEQLNQRLQEASQSASANGQPGKGKSGQGNSQVAQALQQLNQVKQSLRGSAQGSQPGGSARSLSMGGDDGMGNPQVADAMRNLANLRQRLSPRNGRAYYDSESAMRFLQDLSGADPNELQRRLNHEVFPTLDRLEADLKREAIAPDEGGRTPAAEDAPEAYRKAVAEYFKKLSR